ncbi:Zn ribbon [Haloarcula tailed virus 2]|uniref:Zn ribbon n=1 Tax=Haloarcula tailed virus 2 TaxID=2877989 RepID=A0AAE9BY68_9CAUD|nr:Zn ribbon [Haloarcula tailed virus 2]UBF23275.1 Zn ribbon [Haloarcula tailed virus 2]
MRNGGGRRTTVCYANSKFIYPQVVQPIEENKTMLSKEARQEYREARHVRHPRQEVKCEHCDTEHRTTVSVDKWSGVACFTCPTCGKIQEC